MKKVLFTRKTQYQHWVGDGFPVRTLFSYDDIADQISPFLLLDYAGPHTFAPTDQKRGVGQHPHRGFETVTIVYAGGVEHRDSAGAGGTIGPGDVQWMTAASGLLHEEFHSRSFAQKGGPFEMVQLWVNLSAKNKSQAPRYQTLLNRDIPTVALAGGAKVRLIAGSLQDRVGPAQTFSPINLWDMRLRAGERAAFAPPHGHTAVLFVLSGAITLDQIPLGAAELVVLDPHGEGIEFTAREDSKILFLGGEPLGEPIVGRGPFVMNTPEEIAQAFADFKAGRMGKL